MLYTLDKSEFPEWGWSTETIKNIYIGERGPLYGYVSYLMASEQKFHKEKAYEAAVTRSPLL